VLGVNRSLAAAWSVAGVFNAMIDHEKLSMYLQILYLHISMSPPKQPRKTLRTEPAHLSNVRRLEQPGCGPRITIP